MRQYHRIALGMVVVAALAVGGCVSTSTYEKMETEKNQEIAALKQQVAASEQDKAAMAESTRRSQAQYDALVRRLSAEVRRGQLQVRRYQNMLTVQAADQVFFESGRADLKPSGKEILKDLGDALKSYNDKIIRVVGYTDNVPVAKSIEKMYPSNWELSVARATSVVRYLQQVGVPPERMIASGRGEYAPVVPNDSSEGRQKNRRIEIMLIDQSLADELSRPKP